MSKVVGDKWVDKVVETTLAKFLENPKLWPGDAARLDTPALKNLVEEIRTRLHKSPQVVGEAKRWRMVYCNGAFQRLAQYQQTSVVARLPDPAHQKVIGELLALTVSDLTPQQLLQRAPQFNAAVRVLKAFVDLHGAPGAGQQQANRQQAKRKVARKGAVAEARTARDRAFLIGARLVRYQRALASHTPNDTATALLLFRELYGSLKGWLVAHETGGIIDAVDAGYPVEMRAFKSAFKKNGDSYVVRGEYTGKGPQKLRVYAPDWDHTDPNVVADWVWRANGRDLPIEGFLAAYPTDAEGGAALEKLLIPEGDADAEWVLSGKAFDALARARDYYTGAVYKRTLKAEECLSAMQQGAAKITGVLAAEKAKEWPSPWTQEETAKFDAISEAAVEKKFPRYPIRTLMAEAQIGKLKTIGSGTRYSSDIILSATSARDPWISLEMLSAFVNKRLQRWNHSDYWRLWADASTQFLSTAQDWNTVEIREDGTIVTETSKSFYPWTLEVVGGEGFYQYRTWTDSIEMWGGDAEWRTRQGVPSAADLLAYKLPEENTDEFLKKLIEENKTTLWKKDGGEWVPRKIGEKEWADYLKAAGSANPPVHVDPIQDIIDGVPPLWLENDPKGGYASADAQGCFVPRTIPYGALSTGGDKTGEIGYDSKLPGFADAFRNGMSTRARFYLGFLNDDYAIFNPSSRTGIAVLKQMFKFRGTGSKPANEEFNAEGGLYSVPWPASRSWVGLADSPPTPTDQAHAQKDPMTSDYDGGLRALSLPKAGLMNMGEILQGAYDAQNNLAKGFFTIGLLWRMTRGQSGADKVVVYGPLNKPPLGKKSPTSGRVGLSPLVPSMYWFEVRNDIPEASPALKSLGIKLKSQRKLERIGLYTFLFNESFRGWVGETEGASGALAERYNANWVGYRPRDYSSVKETGNKSLSKSLMRWSGGEKQIQLYDYQSDAVLRMDDQQGGLLAFDVGVGKTLCALAAIAYARQNGTSRRILCVVPNTIQRQWLQEFQGRLPDYNVVILGQTLRAPSKIQKNSPVWEDFVEMSHKGNRDDSKGPLGGWLWRAVRDHKMPQFEKAKIPWRGKGESGWRTVEAEAKLISQQLLLQGGSVAQDFAYLVPQMSPTHSAKKFPGLAMQYQKSSREERAQRWIAFSEGQYDAMICSEVDFATIAMKPDTLRKHLRASPSLRAMLINQTFRGSSSAAGSGLRQQLDRARKALKEWRTSQSSGWTPTPIEVRKWILDVTFGTGPQGVTVSIPPHLGIPMGNAPNVGAALRAYLKKGIYEMENFSGPFWDETIEKFTSELFGPARDKPDDTARSEYAQLFEEPLYWVIADANGNLVLTSGSPNNWNWFKKNKVHYPDYGPRDYKGDSERYPSVFRFDDPPFRPVGAGTTLRVAGSGSEWDNGTVPLAWASMGTVRSSFVYPDGVGAGKSSSIVALDYQHGGDPHPRGVRYSELDKGWVGKPVGFVSAGDFAKQVAATMSAQWAGSGKKTLQNVFQGYDISTNEPLKKLKGPFHATPLMTYGRGKVGDVPVRMPNLQDIDRRLAIARDYSMLPKLYDTQPAWNLPPTLYFEDLQVDCIICDEAHKYKALFAPRERGGKVAYLQSGQQSKRAWAMEARTSNIKERNGRVMLLTATPAKTSPLEFYNVMQLIGAPGLGGDLSVFSQFGIYTPEQFISRFVKIEDTIIIDADGTTRRGAAATAFINLDKEFTAIFHRYANRKTVLDVKTLRGTQVGKGQGAVYQAGEPEILIPKGDLSKLSIGDRFQLLTGNSKGGYRVQGFLPGKPGRERGGVVIMPPPDKDSSADTVLNGDNWISYTAGKVPLGPPPAVVDIPLTEDQRNLYGGFQKALSRMILEDMSRAVVKVGGQELLTTKKLKVYPSMSRLTLHEQLETYTFEVEIIDTTTRVEGGDVQTKRAVSNRFAQGLALGLEVDVDPVDTLMDYYRRGVGPWAFFGAPAPTDQGILAQTGGLTATIPVLSPAYKRTLSEFKVLAERVRRASRAVGQQRPVQPGDLLDPQEEARYAEIAAEFHPDKKESDRQNWAKPFMKVAGHRYVGSLKLHSKTGVLLNPGGVTNTVTGALQPKDVINVASPRLCAMIDRVLARSVMDVHTATNVTCGNIAFCGNLYIHAWTVIYWTRLYSLTKLFQCWANRHLGPRELLAGDKPNEPTGPRRDPLDPNAGPWIDALEYYGMTPLYWTTANVLRIALPKADFTLTPSTVTANNQEDATLLAIEIMEFVIAGEEEEGYVGEAAAYRQAANTVPLFQDFRVLDIRPQAQPLKDSFDGYYIEGANKIVVMNSEVAPGPSRQDITDKFNGEWGKDKDGGDCAVKKPEFDLLVANSVAYEGVDLQARTCAIHHLDLPWTPSDFIQRQGRGVRQGNLFEVVDSYVYLSRNTVDYFRLQALERKRAWLESALDADSPTFELASNESELLQLACQSVHPDDVEAVCRKAAQKLSEIKREKLIKEFNPLKGMVRGCAFNALVAFVWHSVGIQRSNAENKYKEFLHGARVLREPDTRLMLEPFVVEPSLVNQLQDGLLVGADPENIQQGLDNLNPPSVGVNPSSEDPSDYSPVPIAIEGSFLAPVIVADNASILQIPGAKPVILRPEVISGQTTGEWPQGTPTVVALPFGGLYLGVSVKSHIVDWPGQDRAGTTSVYGRGGAENTETVWVLDVPPRAHSDPSIYFEDESLVGPGEKLGKAVVRPHSAKGLHEGRPLGAWKRVRIYPTAADWGNPQWQSLQGYASTKVPVVLDALQSAWQQGPQFGSTKTRTSTFPYAPNSGGRNLSEKHIRRLGPGKDGDGKEIEPIKLSDTRDLSPAHDERTWVDMLGVRYRDEVVIPYNTGIWESLAEQKLIDGELLETESIFKASIAWQRETAYASNVIPFRGHQSQNSYVWLSGAATPWIQSNWDELTALICLEWMQFIWERRSIVAWKRALKQAGSRKPVLHLKDKPPSTPAPWLDPRPLDEILVGAYDLLVPLSKDIINWKGEVLPPEDPATAAEKANQNAGTAQWWALRRMDEPVRIPWMVGSKLWISQSWKLTRSSSEMHRLLLSGVAANWLLRRRLAEDAHIDPAQVVARVNTAKAANAEDTKERKKATAALGRVNDKTYKNWAKLSDAQKQQTREAVENTLEAATKKEQDSANELELGQHLRELLASQAVSIIEPTLPGLKEFAAVVPETEGVKGRVTTEIGTVSYDEVKVCARMWWHAYGIHGATSPWSLEPRAFAAKGSPFYEGYTSDSYTIGAHTFTSSPPAPTQGWGELSDAELALESPEQQSFPLGTDKDKE